LIAIPVPADSAFVSLRVTLDSAEYVLSLAWNQRAAKWFFSLADSSESLIISGQKLVANFPLLQPCRHDARCPAGSLIAYDTSGQELDPHYLDLSGEEPRVLILYTPESELG